MYDLFFTLKTQRNKSHIFRSLTAISTVIWSLNRNSSTRWSSAAVESFQQKEEDNKCLLDGAKVSIECNVRVRISCTAIIEITKMCSVTTAVVFIRGQRQQRDCRRKSIAGFGKIVALHRVLIDEWSNEVECCVQHKNDRQRQQTKNEWNNEAKVRKKDSIWK